MHISFLVIHKRETANLFLLLDYMAHKIQALIPDASLSIAPILTDFSASYPINDKYEYTKKSAFFDEIERSNGYLCFTLENEPLKFPLLNAFKKSDHKPFMVVSPLPQTVVFDLKNMLIQNTHLCLSPVDLLIKDPISPPNVLSSFDDTRANYAIDIFCSYLKVLPSIQKSSQRHLKVSPGAVFRH